VLEVNGITAVIGESFARIFRQNMFNCGMAAIELPKESIDRIFSFAADDHVEISISIEAGTLLVKSSVREEVFRFDLSPFDKALLLAGGWVDYADVNY
jgi:3-isopropylmalate/(R)-2-methylmalate dehydratase small subunit